MPDQLNDIIQNLRNILSTTPGERMNYPEFGCDLSVLAYKPVTTKAIKFAEDKIARDLQRFEPEISVEIVTIDTETVQYGFIIIETVFKLLSNNTHYQFTYTFRLTPNCSARTFM